MQNEEVRNKKYMSLLRSAFFILQFFVIHRYVHNAGSARWGTALNDSRVKRSGVNTNSVSDVLRVRQPSSSADWSGALSAQRVTLPMNPPEVNMITRRPGAHFSTIWRTARSTRSRKSGQLSSPALPVGRPCQYTSSDSNMR